MENSQTPPQNQPEINLIDGNHVKGDSLEAQALRRQRQLIKSFRAKFSGNRKWYDKFADYMTENLGTFSFFVINTLWFVLWVIWNNGLIPGIPAIDPYPHSFLTMMVSLEAIFLSIIVLISQNRQSSVADLREEIDFNINVKAEQEITKILNMLDDIHDHLGLNVAIDEELIEMKKFTNVDEIEEQISTDYAKKKRQ